MLSYLSKLINKIRLWIKDNPREAFLIFIILLIGASFRLYRIGEYMIFLGDEGRDAIVVRRLLVNFDPILIGPGTSIGNMYLGPLYYYMIAPALLLANFSPVGPSVLVTLFGIATIFLVWMMGREWFGNTAGMIASFFYSIAPVVITFSKSSWNPNIMPFFALISIYSIWRVWQYKEFKWLFALGVFFVLTYLKNRKSSSEIKNFTKYSILGIGTFAILMSPLVIFDARHEWRNFGAIKLFFLERQTTVSAR